MKWTTLSSNTFAWLLLILGALEVFAYLELPYTHQPRAALAPRNPTTWRGWPEYLRGAPVSPAMTAAVISNSQGVGRELRDANDLYVPRMRRMAREQGIPLQIENWSLEGIRLAEIEMLTLEAVKRQIDLLVIVISPGNIDRPRRLNLDFGISDVDLVAGDPALWHGFLDTGLREHTSVHDVLKRSLLLNSHLARSRIAVHDIAATWLDPRLDMFVFGQHKNRSAHLRVDQAREHIAEVRQQHLTMPAENWRRQLEVLRRPAFDVLFGPLQRRLRAANMRLLWIWMPLSRGYGGEQAVRGAQAFQADVCVTIRSAGFDCADLSGTIPEKYFLPAYQWTHLDKQGHRLFAETLFPLLRDALH